MPIYLAYDDGLHQYVIRSRKKSTDEWTELKYDADIVEWCMLSDEIAQGKQKSESLMASHLFDSVMNSTVLNRAGIGSIVYITTSCITKWKEVTKKLRPVVVVNYEEGTITYAEFYSNSERRARYFNELKEQIKHIEAGYKRIENVVKSLFDIIISIGKINATLDDAERVLGMFDAELHRRVEEEVGIVDSLVAENERIVVQLKLVLKDDGTPDGDITGGRSMREFVSVNVDMADNINEKITYLLERIENWELSHEPLDVDMS